MIKTGSKVKPIVDGVERTLFTSGNAAAWNKGIPLTIALCHEMTNLRDALAEWTERDVAEFHLARLLGIIGPDVSFATDTKHLFWSDNAIGDSLDLILSSLTQLGALEIDEERVQVRWNATFNWEAVTLRKSSFRIP